MSSKCKILLVGTIGDRVDEFVKKLTSLQVSKAGPFDACFCVGSVDKRILLRQLPLPVYLQDASTLTDKEGLVELAPNLHALATAQIVSLDIDGKAQLVVASCPPRVQWDSDSCKALRETVSHVSYVGCDLLLTSEWPQGIEQVVLQQQQIVDTVGSYDVAQVALHARPRYHVAPATHGTPFLQSPPFRHLAATSSTFTPKHMGRFLSLHHVVSPAETKTLGKAGKFVHALGMTPLQSMTAVELQVMPEGGVLPNPYTDASYPADDESGTCRSASTMQAASSVGLSEAQARRLLFESTTGHGDSHNRWDMKNKRPRGENDNDDNSNNSTLFVHGLHKDVRGMLQTGSAVLLEAFGKFQVERVRRPPGSSSFAFLEFPSHELARACLEELGGETVVAGIHLTLKWASNATSNKKESVAPFSKRQRLMEADAMDSSTIYYRLPSKILSTEFAESSEQLRQLLETSLEKALADPTVTAKTEPALQVKARRPTEDKNFGFMEFASHAAASMALATVTGSTDGGLTIAQDDEDAGVPTNLLGVALHWAHDAKPPPVNDGGLKFQRKHFPPDARKDCWFCLASPTCEKHLVVSVHEECYIAMPKGPVHPEGHVLIVPVTHSSKGALVDRSVAGEMEDLKTRLRKHALEKWNMDLFVFERAIQTKGGYHTHVQCIPIERGLGIKLQATMVALAKSIPGFDLKELNSDLALSAMAGDDGEEDGGYFYAEVPLTSKECKRFLYKARLDAEQRGAVVPLQFGREVLASVMDKPDLAHWKACVQDEEKETELTASFRESFAPFAPANEG